MKSKEYRLLQTISKRQRKKSKWDDLPDFGAMLDLSGEPRNEEEQWKHEYYLASEEYELIGKINEINTKEIDLIHDKFRLEKQKLDDEREKIINELSDQHWSKVNELQEKVNKRAELAWVEYHSGIDTI